MTAKTRILAHVADFSGQCHFNTAGSISRKLGINARAVRRAIAELVAGGRVYGVRELGSTFYRAVQ